MWRESTNESYCSDRDRRVPQRRAYPSKSQHFVEKIPAGVVHCPLDALAKRADQAQCGQEEQRRELLASVWRIAQLSAWRSGRIDSADQPTSCGECHHRTCRDSYHHREEESAPWMLEAAPGPASNPSTGTGHVGDDRLSLRRVLRR